MDIEPIYCAEQIVVPPDLADILKAYTKEVVRRQPEDLLEFSAIYFANLANVSGGPADSVIPPTIAELRQVYDSSKAVGLVQLEEFVSLCTNAGIASTTLDAMFRLGDFTGDMVDPKEPLVLLLTMTDSTFMGVVNAIFRCLATRTTWTRQSSSHCSSSWLHRIAPWTPPLSRSCSQTLTTQVWISCQLWSSLSCPLCRSSPKCEAVQPPRPTRHGAAWAGANGAWDARSWAQLR